MLRWLRFVLVSALSLCVIILITVELDYSALVSPGATSVSSLSPSPLPPLPPATTPSAHLVLPLYRKPWEEVTTVRYYKSENVTRTWTYQWENRAHDASCVLTSPPPLSLVSRDFDRVKVDRKTAQPTSQGGWAGGDSPALAAMIYTYHGAHDDLVQMYLTWGRYW